MVVFFIALVVLAAAALICLAFTFHLVLGLLMTALFTFVALVAATVGFAVKRGS